MRFAIPRMDVCWSHIAGLGFFCSSSEKYAVEQCGSASRRGGRGCVRDPERDLGHREGVSVGDMGSPTSFYGVGALTAPFHTPSFTGPFTGGP